MCISSRIAASMFLCGLGLAASVTHAQEPLLVILSPTGEERDGLPVLEEHSEPAAALEGLSRGLSGAILRVYRMTQTYLANREGRAVEPAYVLLAPESFGFARQGFFLGNVEKRANGYVDVDSDWPITGTFGAIDQIVPHELAHVMRRQLVGEMVYIGTNQIHALGVRTDHAVAFNEGFAEHLQAVAFDESEGQPQLAALAADTARLAKVHDHLDRYRRELAAQIAIAPPMRMGFVAWYSNDEDVLRYHGVKNNYFAREANIPARLLRGLDPYNAYLLENVLPGAPDGAAKSLPRMLATEGVVASLFYRWAMHARVRAARPPQEFYSMFGASRDEVSGLENVYLKLAEVSYLAKPQSAMDVIVAYRERFPEEASWVDEIVAEVFLGKSTGGELPPELWMANREFETGTTLFDQYRGLPRVHTFDLNGASLTDLVSVPGVDLDLARRIRAKSPFARLEDLATVPEITEDLVEQFREMAAEMPRLRAELEAESEEDTLSINSILMPSAWRALTVLLLASAGAALAYRTVRMGTASAPGWLRSVGNGLGAGTVGLIGGWLLGGYGMGSIGAVLLLFALPAVAWQLARGGAKNAPRILAAWALAAVPAAILSGVWL